MFPYLAQNTQCSFSFSWCRMLFKCSNAENQRCAQSLFFRLDTILKHLLCVVCCLYTPCQAAAQSYIVYYTTGSASDAESYELWKYWVWTWGQWFVSIENEERNLRVKDTCLSPVSLPCCLMFSSQAQRNMDAAGNQKGEEIGEWVRRIRVHTLTDTFHL